MSFLKKPLNSRIHSLRKRLNYKLIEWQKKKRLPIVAGYPYWLTIDPSSACNLQCRFCPTGQRRNVRPEVVLPFGDFKRIIDTLGPYLLHIDFCNWGEPLINRDIFRMITYAKRYDVTMKIDTNLSIPLLESQAEELMKSGLDRLTVSLDGASQKTYEIYRRNGNFETVIRNVRLLTNKKRELGVHSPHIHWQFLVFKHNEHEIETAKQMSRDVGVDSIGFTAPFCSPDWVSGIDEFNRYKIGDNDVSFKPVDAFCEWLWDGIAINADGSVSPCCSVEEKKDDFGNFFRKPFWLLWNNKDYRTARAHMKHKEDRPYGNVCTRCDHAGASNHTKVHL